MNEFAKLFEVQRNGIDYQVLCTRRYDDDEDEYLVSIETTFNEAICNVATVCKSRDSQIKLFNAFNEESAERFLNSEMIAGFLDAEVNGD